MSGYKIINSDNEVINTINATLDFCEEAYPDYTYELVPVPETPVEEEARRWRDGELLATDYIVPLTDHPQRDDYINYRQNLRDWPESESYPHTTPEL